MAMPSKRLGPVHSDLEHVNVRDALEDGVLVQTCVGVRWSVAGRHRWNEAAHG